MASLKSLALLATVTSCVLGNTSLLLPEPHVEHVYVKRCLAFIAITHFHEDYLVVRLNLIPQYEDLLFVNIIIYLYALILIVEPDIVIPTSTM